MTKFQNRLDTVGKSVRGRKRINKNLDGSSGSLVTQLMILGALGT